MSEKKTENLTIIEPSYLEKAYNEGLEIYKLMLERMEQLKKKDRKTILEEQRKKRMEEEKKKKMIEEERKSEERLLLLLNNSNNLVTNKLDNGDLLLFSGENMGDALKTSFRFSVRNNRWTHIKEKKETLPRTMDEYNKKMAEMKEKTIENVKKEMEKEFITILGDYKNILNDRVKNSTTEKKD